jgi:hypothetical protein
MKKLIFGLIIGLVVASGTSYAYRFGKPQRITDFDQNGLVILNTALEQLWDVSNGRYSINILTVNPDGSRGSVGDMVLLSTGGKYYLEICVATNTWRGVELTNTP